MTTREEAAEQLRVIRSMMERATIFRALSGETALVGGAIALGVAYWIGREAKRFDQVALGMVLGGALGNIVDRILKGTKPGEIAPEVGAKMSQMVNPCAAENQGITLPESLIKEAADVVK